MLQTEFAFTLPSGYVDPEGTLHRDGTMRLATALDEIEPLRDARVRANEPYLGILLLSRVVTRLGEIGPVSPELIGALFSSDYVYLQDLYVRANKLARDTLVETACPACGSHFVLDVAETEQAA